MAVVTTYKTVESLGTNHAGATTKAGEFISDFGNGSFAPTTLLEVQTTARASTPTPTCAWYQHLTKVRGGHHGNF